MVVTDDENKKGAWIAYHDSAIDSAGPQVYYVNPPNGATNQRTSTRIGLSFSDQIEPTTASSPTSWCGRWAPPRPSAAAGASTTPP